MPDRDDNAADLPSHMNDAVQEMARLHGSHHQERSFLQSSVERLTAALGRPSTICILCAAVAAWFLLNGLSSAFGAWAIDPPPFGWLTLAITLASFFVVVLVLATQRREGQLAELREQLTLQLAIMNDQKAAKIIALLQELRRDTPHLDSRDDRQADAMAEPADPHAVAQAISETHAEAEEADAPRGGGGR